MRLNWRMGYSRLDKSLKLYFANNIPVLEEKFDFVANFDNGNLLQFALDTVSQDVQRQEDNKTIIQVQVVDRG